MDHRDVIDGFLELAVVPSFSAIGIRMRRRLWRWSDPVPGALVGRTALVTGATGGLGRAAAEALGALGARVLLLGREPAKLAELSERLTAAAGQERFPTIVADMSSLEDVRAAAEAIRDGEVRLDVLVDNAGSIFPQRIASVDGIEASMALMTVGPFALVGGLLPLLRATDDARVIAVTSGGMYTQPIDVDDLDGAAVDYNGPRFYARAKRAQVALVREWARRASGAGIAFNAMHPGWARTPGLTASLPGFDQLMGPILRTPEEGVDTIVWLATAPKAEIGNGRLYLDRRPRPFDRAPFTRLDAGARRRLWDTVVRRSGGLDPAPR